MLAHVLRRPALRWAVGLLALPAALSAQASANTLGAVISRYPDGSVRVREVVPGGPAAAAGLREGDVVMMLDGKPVGDGQALVTAVRTGAPGTTLELTVRRGWAFKTAKVRVAERPAETVGAAAAPGPVATVPVTTPVTVQPAAAPAAGPAAAATVTPRATSVASPRDAGREVPRGTYLLVDGYGKHRHRTFLPGGLVYGGLPAGGPEVFGAAQASAGDPRELGSYTLQGETLTVTWGGGQPVESSRFELKEGAVVLDGYPYRPLARYPAGHRLDGSYTTRSYGSTGVAGGGTTTWSGASTVVFRPDGTFDYGRSGSASTTAGAGVSAAGESATSGRYAISGNTVTFTFADGRVQHALVHPWSGEERERSPSSVNLNGATYTRR